MSSRKKPSRPRTGAARSQKKSTPKRARRPTPKRRAAPKILSLRTTITRHGKPDPAQALGDGVTPAGAWHGSRAQALGLFPQSVIHVAGALAGGALCGQPFAGMPQNPIPTLEPAERAKALEGFEDVLAFAQALLPGSVEVCRGCLNNARRMQQADATRVAAIAEGKAA